MQFILLASFFLAVFTGYSEPVHADWQCNSPRNTSYYDYIYTEGYRHYRAEVIRERVPIPAGWGDNCGVPCTNPSGCGSCECRCGGDRLYCADIWRDFFTDEIRSQSCWIENPSSICVPSADITSPASGSAHTVGDNITFNTNAVDGNGEALSYRWRIRRIADEPDSSSDRIFYTRTFSLSNLPADSYRVYLNVGNKQGVWTGWKRVPFNVIPPAPTVTLNANKSEVIDGQEVTLTWTVSNATDCTAKNGSGGWNSYDPTHADGTYSYALEPDAPANYDIECTGPGGSDSDSKFVDWVDTLGVSISTTNQDGETGTTFDIGDQIRWSANVSGGKPSFLYSWSGGHITGTNSQVDKLYGSTGTFTAQVQVQDGSGQTKTDTHTITIEDNRVPQ